MKDESGSPNRAVSSTERVDVESNLGSLAESLQLGAREPVAAESVGSGKSNKFSHKAVLIKDNPLFVCVLKIILFQDYDLERRISGQHCFSSFSCSESITATISGCKFPL